jgi:polyisoprenoid-binding protein YceI
MSTIQGRFDRMSGRIVLDRAAKTGSIEVKVDTASITTGDAKHEPGSFAFKAYGPRSRDEHLRSADFFNVAEFPEAVYKSTKLNFNGDVLESVDGQLTLLGVTKPVKLTVTHFKCGPHPFTKKDMCGADAVAQIKRTDFGMKTFVGPVADDVKLTFNIEAYKE